MCLLRESFAHPFPTAAANFQKISYMDTKYDAGDSPGPLFHPLTGLETASRWNAATLEWMTKGFQQWAAWMTGIIAATRPSDRPTAATARVHQARAARPRKAPVSRARGKDGDKPAARSRRRS